MNDKDKYIDLCKKIDTTSFIYNDFRYGKLNKKIHLMSMTKTFIGFIYQNLFDQKIIDKKYKISKYIKEWNNNDYSHVTFDQLLKHTSGLQDDITTTIMYKSQDIKNIA